MYIVQCTLCILCTICIIYSVCRLCTLLWEKWTKNSTAGIQENSMYAPDCLGVSDFKDPFVYMFIVYCSYVLQCYSLIMFFLGMFADFVTCNLCQENFYSLDELNRHRSEKHKYKQIIEGKTYQIPNNYVWQYSFAFFNVLLHNIPFYLPPYLICAISI